MSLTPSSMKLKPGDPAPDFRGLKCATCGHGHSLSDFNNTKALLVIFMCNHCPYVRAKAETITALNEKYSGRGVEVLGINSNDAAGYPEDDFEGMRREVKSREYEFHYVADESQDAARAYGASCTPDPFLFDSQRKLAYHGRFNDALEPGTQAKTADMEDAIDAVLSGRKPPHEFLASIGCSIKWKKQPEGFSPRLLARG
ncbi:thioredoxin family protein [Candidatus Micrarchaeota archaeon]|nr:thioredoxin family protein [Candidatus Micrarchaeota archaeon]